VARRRSRRRIAITALVAALVGAVVGLAVTGSGEPASALRLLSGGAWLGDGSTGAVSHVNGYSGGSDAQAVVGKPGDPFEVVQRADGAYVLDLRTGRLSRLDDSTLAVATSRAETGPAAALQVVAGPDTTWVVDHSSGIVQQLDPSTLAPIGHQIPLGGPTGTATLDVTGSIWVPVSGQAAVDQVDSAGAVARHPFGHAGDRVQVADTSGGVWAVDPQTATAKSLQNPGVHSVQLPATSGRTSPLVAASASSPELAVVAGTSVLDIDTSPPSLSSLTLPPAAQTTQVTVSQGRAYLLDGRANQLQTIELAPLRTLASVPVPAGSDQLVTKDNLVFVNSSGSSRALVVNPNGAVTGITKYTQPVPNHLPQGRAIRRGLPTVVPGRGRTPAPTTTPTGPSTASPVSAPPVVPAAPPTTQAPAPPGTGPPATPVTSTPSPPSPPTSTTVPPAVPGVPTVTQVSAGDGVVTVSWSPPAVDGGSPVLRYQVTAAPSGASRSVAGSTTTVALTGLADGTRQCVQVQAVNQVGGGPLTPAGRACATPLKDSPGQVGAVRAGESAPGRITLSWRQPSLGPYHTPITRYTVRGGPAVRTVSSTSVVIAGLAAGTTYSFSVAATNSTGNSGPASVPTPATTWAPPGRVGNLTVTGADKQLTIKWGAAPSPAGSPQATGYEISVGGGSFAATSGTSVTKGVPAWTNEKVTVYAVNSVGGGARSSASGTAWARSTAVECEDVLSGDLAVLNTCPTSPGAWVHQPSSPVSNWVTSQRTGAFRPAQANRYLCVSYFSGAVSGDRYALATTASGCPAALKGYQPPDTPHPIAYVSTKSIDGSSRQVCEYAGQTKGDNGTFTSYELSPCGKVPSNLSKASKQFSFYT
jgi:hypothetical protein